MLYILLDTTDLRLTSIDTLNEPRHDKTNEMSVGPAKTQISLGIRPVSSESSLSAWRKLGSLATYWAHSEDSDQTGRMPRLIWVFPGRTLSLLVLSRRSSNLDFSSLMFECVHVCKFSRGPSTGFEIVKLFFFFSNKCIQQIRSKRYHITRTTKYAQNSTNT